MEIMVNETSVVMDRLGRILVPKSIRKLFATNKFIMKAKHEEIVLKPVKNLKELFGTLPRLSAKGLKEEHEHEHFT